MDKLGKLIVERVEDVTALDPATDKLLFIMDEPTSGSLECGADTVWAEGKGGRRLYALDRSKTAQFTCTNGYLVLSALQAQVGGEMTTLDSTNTVNVPVVEYIQPSSGALSLSYTPVADSLKYIYVANSDLTQSDTSYTVGSDAATQFTLTGQSVTLPTEADATATYIAIYDRVADSGYVVTDDSNVFAGNAKVIFTILCHDACDVNKKIYSRLVFPRAKVDGNFTLDISGDPVTQELIINAMDDPCSIDKTYWNWYVID